ncbi:hypothetical protein LTR67_011074 [Exophiala xenobiotica]
MSSKASTEYQYVRPIPAQRAQHKRSKSGCLACRLRRKKCDEQKPICKGCKRQRLICSWHGDSESGAQLPDFAWRKRLKAGFFVSQSSPTVRDEQSSKAVLPAALQAESSSGDSDKESHPNHLARRLSAFPGKISDMPLFSLLLRHYICKTANTLVGREAPNNPLLSDALSIAYSNPLVMHALLAVSGMHFQHKNFSPEVQLVTYKYYGVVLTGLKYSLTHWVAGSHGETLHLLLIAMMMCLYESLSGGANGALVQHMRAAREFVLQVSADKAVNEDCDLVGVLMEGYVYFALIAQIASLSTPPPGKNAPLLSILNRLREYKTFGVYLGCAHQLYELIPAVTDLALHKKRAVCGTTDEHTQALHETLRRKVTCWSAESEGDVSTARYIPGYRAEQVAAFIIQNVLLILLHDCRIGEGENPRDIMEDIQPLIDDTMALFELISDAPVSNVIGWSFLILGSVMRREDQKRSLSQKLRSHRSETAYSDRVADVLEWVWSDPDERTFGLAGLEKVARERKTYLCLA